jgi:hypothetical protein
MIILCGCGSVGSKIALELSSLDNEWILIDDDEIEPENVPVSAYLHDQIGQTKVIALAELLWRKNRVIAKPYSKTLSRNVHQIFPDGLVIESFDNPAARLLTINPFKHADHPVIHIGVDLGEVGSVVWDVHYRLPEIDFNRGNNPVCTRQAGANIIRFTVTIAVYAISQYLSNVVKNSYFINNGMIVRMNK